MTDSAASPAHTVVCTIVARNYLPAARVLADSYLRHHPGGEFVVLLVDATPQELAELARSAPALRLLAPDDLDIEPAEFRRMATAYTVTELCTAVKPALLQRLLTEHQVAIYLDPDIEVFAPFGDEVAALAVEHGIVLTPHVLAPMPRDGKRPTEGDIMASGVFNLGFIGVSASSPDAAAFLDFWAERLRHDAISAPEEQLFTDQRWVDNVPTMFRHTVITDPGYNVAYWNVYQRPLERAADGTITAAGRPLRFYHFSGYRPEKPWLLSTHFADKPRVLLSENPLLRELCDSYREKLLGAGYADSLESVPYRWNTLPDGTTLSLSLRRLFRRGWVEAERKGEEPPPTPFDETGTDAFVRWVTSPADGLQAAAGLNRWAYAVWQSRTDLQVAFRDPMGADYSAFRQWCATSGIREGALPVWAVPQPRKKTAALPPRDQRGANVLGYLTAELGVGEMGRLVHDAVHHSGLPVATVVEEETVHNRTEHPLPAGANVSPPHFPVSVLCVNADMTPLTLRIHPQLGRDRYVIGVWSWELEDFPPSMHQAFELVDEVWTISEFCRRSIAARSPVPVHTFPVPVRDVLEGMPPERSSTDDGYTRFLFAFDFNSLFDRKNPLGVITAFRKAFPVDEPGAERKRLVIKSINGEKHPEQRERLRAAAAADPRIELVEGYLSHDEVRKLFASADCYVSLHRSEGFGLTVAEAMAHGLPVIATDYSGSAEFLTGDTGWRIPYRMVPVGPNQHPYPPDAQWAEPDLDAAAAAMREVAADPATARRRGQAAREHILRSRTMAAAGAWVRERLEAAYQEWRRRRTETGPQEERPEVPRSQAGGVLQPVRDSREALRWRADAEAPSRIPLAPVLRRGVLRVLDHYDVHQRKVLGALMDGVEQSLQRVDQQVGELRSRLDEQPDPHLLAERLDRVEARLAELGEQVAQFDQDSLRRMVDELRSQLDSEHTERFAHDQQLAQRLDQLEERLARTGDHVETVDRKFVGMFAERDTRLDLWERRLAQAGDDLRRRLRALDSSVRRHHDLLGSGAAVPDGETVATDVGLLRLPQDDTVVLPWLRTYASWEETESWLVDQLLSPGATFVDIGAHVGYYTLRALSRTGPYGAVFAVEPWERLRHLLEYNVRSNLPAEVASTLTVLPFAAWDDDGTLRLQLSEEGNSGDNRVNPDGGPGALEVPGRRLAEVEALQQRTLSVVKVDAQGRDHRALSGLAELLLRDRPHVVCEFWPEGISDVGDDPRDVLARYRSWGYQPVQLDGEGAPSVEELQRLLDDPRQSVDHADEEIVERARRTESGFVTLWLRPLPQS